MPDHIRAYRLGAKGAALHFAPLSGTYLTEGRPLAAEGSAKPSEEYARTVVSISSSAAGKFGPHRKRNTRPERVPIMCRMNQGQERTCAEALFNEGCPLLRIDPENL